MFNKSITKEELQSMPVAHYEGKVALIDKKDDVASAMEKISKCDICGVDTETLPNFKKGTRNAVALLQIAINQDVFLIRINKTGITKEIVAFLENPNICKVGVALKEDIRDLNRVRPIKPVNIVDLNDFCKNLQFESIGAKKLSALILGFRITKGQQTSNWEASELSEAQKQYAATDAWICREIYLKLQNNIDQIPCNNNNRNQNPQG